jgi:phosphotransferase system enzyme I (PtsP)
MVTSIEEIRELHAIFDDVRRELNEQGYATAEDVPVGSMVEVPSALLALEQIVQEVDFVSVGTNDLVQYLLAADRDNPLVSDLYDPTHPAVVRALQMGAEVARRHGRFASVCGDMASDPATAVLLLGMGYDAVSVAPQFVPEIKYAIRRTSLVRAQEFARLALEQDCSAGVREVLDAIRGSLYQE